MTPRALAVAGAFLALALAAPVASARPAAGSPADHSFLVGAARNNLAEIAGGKLALSKSHSKAVRDYARSVIADHQRAQAKLAAVARATHTTLPTEPSAAAKRDAARLASMSGDTFNRRYFSRQIVDHRKAMGAILLELHAGDVDPAVAYASSMMPVTTSHMEMARKDLARMMSAA
jgi:putative membrane protein